MRGLFRGRLSVSSPSRVAISSRSRFRDEQRFRHSGPGFDDAVTLANEELGNVFAGTESIDQMLADFKTALGS